MIETNFLDHIFEYGIFAGLFVLVAYFYHKHLKSQLESCEVRLQSIQKAHMDKIETLHREYIDKIAEIEKKASQERRTLHEHYQKVLKKRDDQITKLIADNKSLKVGVVKNKK